MFVFFYLAIHSYFGKTSYWPNKTLSVGQMLSPQISSSGLAVGAPHGFQGGGGELTCSKLPHLLELNFRSGQKGKMNTYLFA